MLDHGQSRNYHPFVYFTFGMCSIVINVRLLTPSMFMHLAHLATDVCVFQIIRTPLILNVH